MGRRIKMPENHQQLFEQFISTSLQLFSEGDDYWHEKDKLSEWAKKYAQDNSLNLPAEIE
jgi:hypothetical protein